MSRSPAGTGPLPCSDPHSPAHLEGRAGPRAHPESGGRVSGVQQVLCPGRVTSTCHLSSRRFPASRVLTVPKIILSRSLLLALRGRPEVAVCGRRPSSPVNRGRAGSLQPSAPGWGGPAGAKVRGLCDLPCPPGPQAPQCSMSISCPICRSLRSLPQLGPPKREGGAPVPHQTGAGPGPSGGRGNGAPSCLGQPGRPGGSSGHGPPPQR